MRGGEAPYLARGPARARCSVDTFGLTEGLKVALRVEAEDSFHPETSKTNALMRHYSTFELW